MEKLINLIVGIILFSNLYYLSPLLGLSSFSVLISLIIICSCGFIFRYKRSFSKLLMQKLTIRLIVLSFILFIIQILSDYKIYINDISRITLYTLYFGWTLFLFKNKIELYSHLKKQLFILFFLIIIMSFIEYYFYDLFHLIIDPEFITGRINKRLTITFLDPNAFAFALVSFAYIYTILEKSLIYKLAILFITLLLVNYTGSRLGLLLSLILLIQHLIIFSKNKSKSKYLFLFLIFVSFLLVPKSNNDNSDKASIVQRLTETKQSNNASASSNARISSLNDGLKASNLSNIILPPGNFLFRSKWKIEENGPHYPHSTFLYMIVEYGIYVFWPLLIFIPLYKKSKITKNRQLYFFLMIALFLLPNLIYYSTCFLIIFFIELEYISHISKIKNKFIKSNF